MSFVCTCGCVRGEETVTRETGRALRDKTGFYMMPRNRVTRASERFVCGCGCVRKNTPRDSHGYKVCEENLTRVDPTPFEPRRDPEYTLFGNTSGLVGNSSGLVGKCSLEGLCTGLYGDCTGLHGNPSDVGGDCTGLHGDCSGLRGDCTGLRGDCTGLHGVCSDLYGDCSEVTGNCTGLRGDCTGLRGDLSRCSFWPGTDIETLVAEGAESTRPPIEETQLNCFKPGMFVMPDSPQCPLDEEDGPFEVLECHEEPRTISVRGHTSSIPIDYFRISHKGACSRAHIARCNADMDRWSEQDRKLKAAWKATAHGRTDEQRLLEHLGISPDAYLVDSYVNPEREYLWHRLLINQGIECLEGGYPYCEACFGSIRACVQAGSKEAYLNQLRETNERATQERAQIRQAPIKGYMDRTGRLHSI